MAQLQGNTIASTYTGLLSVTGAVGADTVEAVTDGAGTSTSLSLSQQRATITLGSGAADDFIVDGTTLVVEGDNNRVGIGTATPSETLTIAHAAADGDGGILIINEATTIADDTFLGGIGFDSADGNIPSSVGEASAFISARSAEAHGTGDKGGDLLFGTAAIDQDDDTTTAERMRINSEGNVGIADDEPVEARLSIGSVLASDYGLKIVNAQATSSIFIDQNGNGSAIEIDSEATTGIPIFIDTPATTSVPVLKVADCNSLTTGSVAELHSNSSDTGTRNVVQIQNDHASATGATVLKVIQDAAQTALLVDQNANGAAIKIDTEATGQHGIIFDAPTQTTGSLFLINDCDALTSGSAMQVQCASGSLATTANAGLIMVNYTGNSTAASNLIYLKNDHVDADATVGLKIKQDGAAASIELEGNGGIKFPGTEGLSSDVNTLDDYEEGTWTAAFVGTSSSTPLTMSATTGTYTRIGSVVHLHGYFSVSSLNSQSGDLHITGLPFAVPNNNRNYSSVCVGYGSNLNITASENLTGYTAVNTSTLILSEWDSAAGTTGFTAADLSADGSIMISVTYMVH